MTRFNTGNPIESNDPRDRDDNSKNLDVFMHTDEDDYENRFGQKQKSMKMIQGEVQGLLTAGGKIFDTEAEGRAAADNGQYFFSASDDPDVSKSLYKRLSESESQWIADDPSAEFVKGVAAVSTAALELASQPSELNGEFYGDESDDSLYSITDQLGRKIAAWDRDGYQEIQTRGEFHANDNEIVYAVTDEDGAPLFQVDKNYQLQQPFIGEFHTDDGQPVYAWTDKNGVVFYGTDEQGRNVVGGGDGKDEAVAGDVVLRQNASATITRYDLPLKISLAEAEALSDADRLLRDWYYVGGELLHRDDLPSGVPQTFGADDDFLTGDVASISLDEQNATISVTSDGGLPSYGARYVMFRATGQAGNRTEFAIGGQSSWNTPRDTSRHILSWSDDLDGDNWRAFDNLISDNVNNQWRASNNFDFGGNTIYVASLPHYSYGRVQRKNSEWMRNRYTRPTLSAVDGFSIGTLDARVSARLGKTLPASPQFAFRVGTGEHVIVMISGVHTDERPGFYQLEGAMELIISDTDEAAALRKSFTFIVYPALNGQGLMAGAQRWEPEGGEDANRLWGVADPSTTQLAQMYLAAWELDLTEADVAAVFDFHSTPAANPNTTLAAQIWYDIANQTPAEAALLEQMSEFRDYEIVDSDGLTGTRNGIRDRYGSKVTLTAEFNHDVRETVNTWRQWGVDLVRGMQRIKDIL